VDAVAVKGVSIQSHGAYMTAAEVQASCTAYILPGVAHVIAFVIAHVIAYMVGHVIAYAPIRLSDRYVVDIGAYNKGYLRTGGSNAMLHYAHASMQQLASKSSQAQNSCCCRWLVTRFIDHMSAGQVQWHVIRLCWCYQDNANKLTSASPPNDTLLSNLRCCASACNCSLAISDANMPSFAAPNPSPEIMLDPLNDLA